MKYRVAKQDDIPKILALAEKNKIQAPNFGTCFVADKDGEIIGYLNGGAVNFLDSFVSGGGVSGLYLMAMMEGALTAFPTTFAGTINDEAGDLLLKLGYEEVTNTRFFIKKG